MCFRVRKSQGTKVGVLEHGDDGKANHPDKDAQNCHNGASFAPGHVGQGLPHEWMDRHFHRSTSTPEKTMASARWWATMRPSSRSIRALERAASSRSWVT